MISNTFDALIDRYGEEAARFLEGELERAQEGCEFVDNVRVCDVDKHDEVSAFDQAEAQGCCGSHDEEVEFAGHRYKIGFNHGH